MGRFVAQCPKRLALVLAQILQSKLRETLHHSPNDRIRVVLATATGAARTPEEKCPALAAPVVKNSSASYSSRRKQPRCVERSEAGVARFESVEFALSRSAEVRERRCPRETLTIPPKRFRLPFAVANAE